MRRIIKNREIVGDNWLRIGDEDAIPNGVDVIVPLARFLNEREQLSQRSGRLGVEIGTDAEPADIANHLTEVDLVVVSFPKFTDGRGYSIARLLRSRFGWQGELRAAGDVLPDQVFYLHRCGFNAFEVRADKRLDTALEALESFSVTYQGAEDGLPLYRRRFAARRRAASQ